MKKITLITSVVLMAVAFIACKSSKPEPVVEKYYTHFFKGEFQEVKKYVMEEHYSYYDLLASLSSSENKEELPDVKVTNIKCEIQDDVATCKCDVRVGDQSMDGQTIQLKKVGKEWLVNQGKETGMSAADDEDEADEIMSEEQENAEDVVEKD